MRLHPCLTRTIRATISIISTTAVRGHNSEINLNKFNLLTLTLHPVQQVMRLAAQTCIVKSTLSGLRQTTKMMKTLTILKKKSPMKRQWRNREETSNHKKKRTKTKMKTLMIVLDSICPRSFKRQALLRNNLQNYKKLLRKYKRKKRNLLRLKSPLEKLVLLLEETYLQPRSQWVTTKRWGSRRQCQKKLELQCKSLTRSPSSFHSLWYQVDRLWHREVFLYRQVVGLEPPTNGC